MPSSSSPPLPFDPEQRVGGGAAWPAGGGVLPAAPVHGDGLKMGENGEGKGRISSAHSPWAIGAWWDGLNGGQWAAAALLAAAVL
jgi:hypothetical protein